jgi:hypothetical protein
MGTGRFYLAPALRQAGSASEESVAVAVAVAVVVAVAGPVEFPTGMNRD